MLPGPKIYLTLFGGVRAWRTQQPLDVGPPQRQALLGLLLAADGRVVSVEDLIDTMWGDRPSASALNLLHRHVGKLRRTFEPSLPARGTGRWLLRAGSGYQLLVDEASSDLRRFRLLNASAAASASSSEVEVDLRLQALALASGAPGEGLPFPLTQAAPFLVIERERVETGLAAAAAALRCGRAREVVPHLVSLVARHPLDEALHAALIDCMGAAGQRADALEVFASLSRRLDKELGVTTSPLVEEARRRVLSVLSSSSPSPAAAVDPGRGRPVARAVGAHPTQLPSAPSRPGLSGRSRELALADATLTRPAVAGHRICAITGGPGVGKTDFALYWANRVSSDFPDGQLYVQLGDVDPREVLRGFLRALGAPLPSVDDQTALAAAFHQAVRGRRLLFVLDDAQGSQQVRALLPGDPQCLVVATSRFCLTGVIAHEGAQPVPLS